MSVPQNLLGQKFGRLTPLFLLPEKEGIRTVWECKCDCGNIVRVKSCHLKSKHTKSCGCFQKEISLKNIEKYHRHLKRNNLHGPRWNGVGDLYGSYVRCIEVGAIRRNIEFTVTKEYLWDLFLKQGGKCNLSGLKIELGYKTQTASIDRIDNSKGYEEGNIQWLHKDINVMKMDFDTNHFLQYCRLIVNNHEK